MSNYLNNLAARTLNLTSIVQPRLASLFEPVSFVAGNKDLASIDSEPMRNDAAPAASTFDRSSVRSLVSQDDNSSDAIKTEPTLRGIDQSTSHINNDARQRPFDELAQSEVTWPAQRIIEPIGPTSLALERERSSITSLHVLTDESQDTQTTRSAFGEYAASDPENESRRRTTFHPIEFGHSDPAGAHYSNNRDRIQPTAARPTLGSIHPQALVQPDRFSIGKTRRSFLEPPIANELPPTINVTIGRVDVRAVFSQPSAPRVSHARQPAAMSLNEYLKQRNEGHR